MKKSFISLLAVSALVLASCGSSNTECEVCPTVADPANDPTTINVQFVPSKNADNIMLVAPALESLLAANIPGHTFKISVGTDFNAVLEGMDAGQVQVGFLTSQQYAQASLERPGKVQVLLTSVRNAMYVQQLPYAQQVEYMNNQANGYHGEYVIDKLSNLSASANPAQYKEVGTTMDLKATAYAAQLTTMKSTYDAGLTSIKGLAGKKVCALSSSSGSGYIYPSVLFYENGLTWTTSTPDATKGEVQYIQVSGHTDSLKALLRGDCDAAFSYNDARRDLYWASASSGAADSDSDGVIDEYKDIFTNTRVVALSTLIYNDTISASTSISQDLRNQIQRAFMDIIKTEDGLKALSAYTHTGYKLATDSDYEGERTVYKFKVEHLS